MTIAYNRHREEKELPRRLADLEKLSFSDPWSEGMLKETLASEHVGLLTLGEEPLGYLMLLILPPEGEVLNLAVHPDCRRQGYASALLREGETVLRRKGVEALYLEVRASNIPAIALYKSFGFAAVGRRKRYYRTPVEDALIMKKEL